MTPKYPGRKRVSWKIGLFWVTLIALTITWYYYLVKFEEVAYNEFILSEWPTHTIKYTEENSPLVGEYITSVTADDKGQVWILTNSALNTVAPDNSWTTLTRDHKNISMQSFAIDRLERIWVGTFNGLYVHDPKGQWLTRDERSRTVYEHYSSTAILIDRVDRVWVAHNDGLRLFLPDGTKIVYTEENSGLTHDYITALAEDRQGNIWIGTRTKGVVVFDKNGQWRTYQENGSKNGLVENWVTSIFIDDQDRVWIGTWRRGISMLAPDGNWTTYNTTLWGTQSNPGYYDKKVNAFVLDEQGRLWIGASGALFVLDAHGNWIAYTRINSALNPDYVKSLTIDGKGRLWIGTHQAVFVLDLRNELPETVSNEWIQRRTLLHIPIKFLSVLSSIGGLIFLPVVLKIYGFWYIVLLVLGIYSVTQIRAGYRIKSSKLLYGSLAVFVLALGGALFIWFMSAIAALMD